MIFAIAFVIGLLGMYLLTSQLWWLALDRNFQNWPWNWRTIVTPFLYADWLYEKDLELENTAEETEETEVVEYDD